MKGLVVFSFALRGYADEPNPCNVRLAKAAERIDALEGETVIVAQWEVARQLRSDGLKVYAVEPPEDGSYLDSQAFWDEAKRIFNSLGIRYVIPVAQPFLQMSKVKKLIAKDGFVVVGRYVGRIGFDRQSSQWWTRGRLRLLAYAVLQLTIGLRGHSGRQFAAKN